MGKYGSAQRRYRGMAMTQGPQPPEEPGITSKLGEVEIDWPRSLGFFGALGVATALELIPIPIAVFVAGVPFLKLLNRPNAPKVSKFVSEVVAGASKPVGGDSEGTIHWSKKANADSRRRARVGKSPASRRKRS
jgi:hypothetical protein